MTILYNSFFTPFCKPLATFAITAYGGASSIITVSTRWMYPFVHSMLGRITFPLTASFMATKLSLYASEKRFRNDIYFLSFCYPFQNTLLNMLFLMIRRTCDLLNLNSPSWVNCSPPFNISTFLLGLLRDISTSCSNTTSRSSCRTCLLIMFWA